MDQPSPVALVVTDQPVAIRVEPLEDERTPEGMRCLGTWTGDRLVARCVVDPEAAAFLEEAGLFDDPVRLALAAQRAAPGLQCRLFALVELPAELLEDQEEEDEEAPEPWAASVPSSAFDRITPSDAEQPSGPRQAAVLLGHIVRFDRDRRHPEHLALEAADVLSSIVSGKVGEVVDKVLEDLLGGG